MLQFYLMVDKEADGNTARFSSNNNKQHFIHFSITEFLKLFKYLVTLHIEYTITIWIEYMLYRRKCLAAR